MNNLKPIFNDKTLVTSWDYKDADGSVVGMVARYQDATGKSVVPMLNKKGGGFSAGIPKALKNKRPLFGLDRLAQHPKDKAVFVVEGEKAAAALCQLGVCAVTSLGGANAALKADWTPLNSYSKVFFLPDNDEAGQSYIKDVYAALNALNVPPDTLCILTLPDLPHKGDVVDWIQQSVKNWDGYAPLTQSEADKLRAAFGVLVNKADYLPDNWATKPNKSPKPARESGKSKGKAVHVDTLTDEQRAEAEAKKRELSETARYAVYETDTNGFRVGVWYHGVKISKDGFAAPDNRYICPPLYIEAGSCDGTDNNYGLLIRFINQRGNWANWLMPREMLAGRGDDIAATLQSKGFATNKIADLKQYLNSANPNKRLECALKTGWHGVNTFVLPDKVIGARDDVFFQSSHNIKAEYGVKGSIEQWQRDLSALCLGNPLMLFQVSVAFTGALLKKVNLPYAGFHVVGGSSKGKTTGQLVAASVWGGKGFNKTWNSTANGLEAIAVMYNDGLLALDELGNSKAKEVDNIIYLLANGKGKNRATVNGVARTTHEWRVALLSNGEKTLDEHLASEGITIKGGQSVRFLEIPVFGKYGAFDDLHGFDDGGALSIEIQRLVEQIYGDAGITYLEQLAVDERDFHQSLNDTANRFKFDGMCDQEGRAVRMFALVALAGELATEYGVTGWQQGEATEAVRACIAQWLENKGTGNTEDLAILEAVRSYVGKYGDLRFTIRSPSQSHDRTAPTGERSGWFEYKDDSKLWLFLPVGLREATKGYDFKQVVRVLVDKGWLSVGSEGRPDIQTRIDGEKQRLYHVKIPE